MSCDTLYGLNPSNCCKKDQGTEKVANALLPIAFTIHARDHQRSVILCNREYQVVSSTEPWFLPETTFETEKAHLHEKFINPPPNDICATHEGRTAYSESKVVLYKNEKTELILRQDCTFNCIQNILLNNPTKNYTDTDSLLSDSTISERPYVSMLIWKNTEGLIYFDSVIFTDVCVIRMIKDAETARGSESLKLIDSALSKFASTGKMTYKDKKSDTVPHQKVSLFPLRDIPALKSNSLTFPVSYSDLVMKDVRSDTNLWHEIDKARLVSEIQRLTR
jgi:hypothetical protein